MEQGSAEGKGKMRERQDLAEGIYAVAEAIVIFFEGKAQFFENYSAFVFKGNCGSGISLQLKIRLLMAVCFSVQGYTGYIFSA